MREIIIASLPDWLPGAYLVPSAEAILLAAMIFTFAGSLWFVARAGLDPRPAYWASICGVIGGFVVGRAWMVLLDGQPVGASLLDEVLQGDKSIMGAIIGGAAGPILWLRLAGQPVLEYFDAAVPIFFVAYAIGRISCLFMACCFGTSTDLVWGIHYPPDTAPYAMHIASGLIDRGDAYSHAVHPAPIYHAIHGLILFQLTRVAQGTRGRPVVVGLIGYGLGRFLIEYFRGDAVPTELGLSIAQLGSIAFIVMGLLVWLFVNTVARANSPVSVQGTG